MEKPGEAGARRKTKRLGSFRKRDLCGRRSELAGVGRLRSYSMELGEGQVRSDVWEGGETGKLPIRQSIA